MDASSASTMSNALEPTPAEELDNAAMDRRNLEVCLWLDERGTSTPVPQLSLRQGEAGPGRRIGQPRQSPEGAGC